MTTTGSSSSSPEDLRRHNAAAVLRLLRDGGPVSRADLARETGLAKATISVIVADLVAAGAVGETGAASSAGRGRPSVPVGLDGRSLLGIGLEVNVDYTAVTVLDLAGREVSFEEVPRRPGELDPEAVVALARDQLAAAERSGAQVLGLTLAVPGLIDRRRGLVVHAPNLGWRDVPLATLVVDGLAGDSPAGSPRDAPGRDLVVTVDNDANLAARAEQLRGVAAGVADVVYLTGTVGLGAGVVSGGAVLRGARGLAGEVGHLRVGRDEPCGCGRTGCWEAVAGQRGLVRASGLTVAPGEDPVSYAARVAAQPDAAERLAPVVAAMSYGVTALALGLDPRLVVLGGAFVPLGEHLLEPLRRGLADTFPGPGCEVALSTLGLHAASVGAALDALDDVLEGRRSVTP